MSRPCYYSCPVCCHHIPLPEDRSQPAVCGRCGHSSSRFQPKSPLRTVVYSLTALIFYVPANIFPFMSIELYGNRTTSTIWGGILSLAESGSWFVAFVVFLASLLIPFLKLVILFYLAATASRKTHPHFKTRLYHFVEAIGRWSMLDIFLLAVLVAIMKLGPWTRVEPEAGSLMFLLVVIFTMFASAAFDPKLLWKEEEHEAIRPA